MSGAEVASVLGSPNIVTTDENRQEVWIYDKISTNSARSSSRGGVATLFLGLPFTGIVGATASASSGATSSSQKTLTVIIKIDTKGRVRDFAYHTSRF